MNNNALAYNAWYETPRGAWIGDTEYSQIRRLLNIRAGGKILDVGCGTGYFSRQLARDGFSVSGVDNNIEMIDVACARRVGDERYMLGDADALPFKDNEFDCAIAITSLCFVPQQARALAEMRRVSKQKVLLGVLNRHSLLYLKKGLGNRQGAYRGARWYDLSELYVLFAAAGLKVEHVSSAVFFPQGGRLSRCMERVIPNVVPLGGILFASADVGKCLEAR
ncbi:MAG: class I SAM-dependent methyltransferase [Pseudomonadota bacterium]